MSEFIADARAISEIPRPWIELNLSLATIFLKGGKKSDSWQKWLNWQYKTILEKGNFSVS